MPFDPHTLDERNLLDSEDAKQEALQAQMKIDLENRTEAALRESEDRFRILADEAPVMIWVSGIDKLCTFFNKPWLDFTGRTMEQELGDGWAKGVHPEDLDRCLAIYRSSFDARQSFRMDYRLRRGDGEYRWVLDHGVPLNRDGQFMGYIGSCIDVTEQRLATEQLRASEARLRDAQRLAKVGSWERSLETGAIQWSDEMFRILGMPRDAPTDFAGFLSYVHPKDRNKILQADQALHSGAAVDSLEYRITRPDGEVRFVKSVVETMTNDQGAPVRILGATQDVTEAFNASSRLQESEERLRNAERLTRVGNWIWDIKGNRVSWSAEIFRIFGQPRTYAPSFERFLNAIIPSDRERVESELRACLANQNGHSIEFQIARADGELRTLTCISQVLLDEEGSPVRMFGACQDVTEARRAQEAALAGQKLEAVGTLATGIAHDFNNLLGGVVAQVDLALREVAAGSSPELQLKAITGIAMRGSEIVRQLMIYGGRESEAPELVDVSQITEGMLELLKVSISKRATLKIELARDLPAVRASAAQISQLVINLTRNASEAIGNREGVIGLTTRRANVGPGLQQIKGLAEGDYVQLEVSDTGCGIPPEAQARVFEPFFSTKSPGRGLGLAVVDGIVRSLGGAVHLVSEQGRSTRVQVFLPSTKDALASIRAPISSACQPTEPTPATTALLVEDEDALLLATSRMLRKEGISVIEARDGSAALDAIRAQGNRIDALLLDITLPGVPSRDVFEEAARLRPEMKVIITSAYSMEMAAALLQNPVEFFIRKPYRFSELVTVIRKALAAGSCKTAHG